jgi:methylmalonyl-CoA carboxyltransferase large subunit
LTLNGIDLVIAAALVAAGCLLTYARLRRAFRNDVAELRRAAEHRLDDLANLVRTLEAQIAALKAAPAAPAPVVLVPVAAPAGKAEAAVASPKPVVAAPKEVAAAPKEEDVTPEILLVMAAAVTAFLGKKVRIRSAKMLQSPYEIVNPWAQQGRVFVQASHNLRPR